MGTLPDNQKNYESKKTCSIDGLTLPCKISCYLLNSAIGCLTKFSNIFYVSIGLTAGEAGFISGLCFAISAVAGPIWGLIADRTGYRKLIFTILCLGLGSATFSWPWIAREVYMRSWVNWSQNGMNHTSEDNNTYERTNITNTSAFTQFPHFQGYICFLGNSLIDSRETNDIPDIYRCIPNGISFSNPLFYAMLSISMITYIFMYPAESFLNSIIANIIQNNPTSQGYGQQRMYGAIGIGITNLIAGFAVDNFSHPTLSKYTAVYILLLPFVLLTIPLSVSLFKRTSWYKRIGTISQEIIDRNLEVHENISFCNEGKSIENDVADEGVSRIKILRQIFSSMDNIVVMITVLVIGTVRSVTFSFLYLIIKDEMNGSTTSMGFSVCANSLPSAIMFFFTKRLIKIFGGPIICVELSLVAWILRLILISYIKNAWLMALPQLLQTFCFSLYWSAMIQYIQEISTKEVYITLFTILTSLQYGAGGFLGNVIGGAVYNSYKGPVLCQYTAIVTGVWFFMVLFYFHGITLIKRWINQTRKLDFNDDSDTHA